MNPANALVEILRSEGIRRVFGNPGTTELPFIEALSRAEDIEYVLGVHEGAVVSMADGYARTTGATSFVNLHVAPGVANGLIGILNAFRSRTPMVVTAGQQDSRHLHHEPMLWADLVAMTRAATKSSIEVNRPGDLPLALRRAFALAATPPTGPVFVSIPMDLLDADADVEVPPPIQRLTGGVAPGVAEAVDLLLAASDPVVIAGDAVGREGAVSELVAIAEAIGATVYHQPMADGVNFPTDHPLFAGMIAPTNAAVRAALSPHDLAFLAGTRAFRPHIYTPGSAVPGSTRLVQVDSDPNEIGFAYPPAVGLVGGLEATLASIALHLENACPDVSGRTERNSAAIAAHRATVETRARTLAGDPPFHPLAAVQAISTALPADALVVEEAITTGIELRKVVRLGAGRYLHTVGGGLGWGIGAAVGARLGTDQPVVAVVGDGCATFGLHGLWSAARVGAPVLILVMNNREYRTLKQQVLDRGRVPEAVSFPGLDLDDPAIDFVGVAQGFGVEGRRVAGLDELSDAVRSVPNQKGPLLVDVPLMRLGDGS